GYAVILAYAARLFVLRRPKPSVVAGLAFGASVWLVASLTVVPIVGGGPFGVWWAPNAVVAAAALLSSGVAVGAAVAVALARLDGDERLARRGVRLASRRAIFGGLIAAGVTVLVVEGARTVAEFLGWGGNGRVTGGSGVFPDVDGLAREVTPTGEFYH